MTHNAARDVFRGRKPERSRLRKRVRAALREDERFAVDGPWCALRELAGQRAGAIKLAGDDYAEARSLPMNDVLARILHRAGGAVAFDQLIDLFIDVTGIALAGETTPLEEEPA